MNEEVKPSDKEPTTLGQANVLSSNKQSKHEKKRRASMSSFNKKTGQSVGTLVLVALVGFGGGWAGGIAQGTAQNDPVAERKVIMNSEGNVIADIANEVGPSVVSIDVTQQVTTMNYFGRTGTREAQAAGTGIIISKDGLILTNRHVVPEGTSSVNVTLSDGTTFEDVEVVGRTSENDTLDIAFLKIKDLKGKKLTVAKVGDSARMKVGDKVVAIGNALGQFQNTVTSGIISGYGRSVTAGDESGSATENLENLFQTDAAINQGNSGGPLVNLAGEVIGVNVAIADNAQNVGFSIPINDVKGLIASIEESGKLERPYIGVVYIPITADVAKDYGLSVDNGAYVAPRGVTGQDPVVPGSPAEKADLKAGDIITKVNNSEINKSTSLTSLLGKHKVGDTIALTIIRDGKTITVDVTLAAMPDSTN
ncbi:MAG: trypsin-like peptidase domain-containing protein [Candidatus Saccharimonadales bacterium]